MHAVWRVEMLGTLKLAGDDATVTRFRTRRVALLLAFLAYHRDRLHSREELGELLWPEQEPEVIRRNLRQALTSLRHVLEPPSVPRGAVLQVHQDRLQLNPELFTTDVADFEQAVAQASRAPLAERYAALKAAADRYRGELLPGFHEEWIVRERLRLEDLYVYSLRGLIDACRQAGHGDEAVHYLRLALAKEPLNEEWHLGLMRQYLDTGRPASALKQFAELRDQLGEHLGCDPSDAAVALRDEASRTSAPPAEPAPSPPSRPSPPAPEVEAVPGADEPKRAIRLPIQLTRFCGRRDEVETTLGRLGERNARLVTLFGPAGTGKTRLSVEVGRRLADTGEWNVWFVPLADIDDASTVLDTVLDTVRARRAPNRDPYDQLREIAAPDGNHLLILDNLEHILDDVAPLIAQIVERVPNLRCLVTSRQILNLGAEHQIPVPPLPFPPESAGLRALDREDVAALAEFPSVQLFVDRCQTVRPDFQLTLHNARAVAAICAKLEGIPLAIELAAGLSPLFAPTQMLFHLQKRLTTLTSRRRDLPARHRSLRAAIDYSYDSLPPDVQAFFAALSVFRGGFTLDAAYEACFRDSMPDDAGVRRHPHERSLDVVLQLQERSLLRAESAEEGCDQRFRMLESFREYAEEHLDEARLRSLRDCHAHYYLQRPLATGDVPTSEERIQRHLWIESEFENYVAALEHCLVQGRYEDAIALLGTLATTWTNRGPRAIERRIIRQLAERSRQAPIDAVARIQLLRMLGTTHIRGSEYAAAYAVCQEALGVAWENDLPEQIAVCYSALSTCAGYLGNLDECLALSLKVLDCTPPENLALRERAYTGIGAVHWGRGEGEAAEAAFLKAAEVSARLRGGEPDTLVLYNLARIGLDAGRFDEAMTRLGDAIRICRRLRDEFGMAMCLSLVSRYHWLRRDLPAALATGHEALLKFRESDFSHWSLLGIHQSALILVDLAEWESATTLLAASQGIGKSARLPDDRDHEAALARIREKIPRDAFERAWARGLAMDAEDAFRLALRYK